MSRTALAFMSYVNEDDRHDNGWMTQFRERLSGEVRMHTGEPFDIFQDRKDIAWGQQWQERINQSLDAVTFLIPILTPAFFKSAACRDELERFLKREETLGRSDLILPVYYVNCPVLQDKAKREHDKLAQVIAARQYTDWRELRYEEFTSSQLRKAITKMAEQIDRALEQKQIGPPTVIVNAEYQGDYATITEALKAVQPTTRILVQPGLYQEGIVINKPVEIIGDGQRDEIIIEAYGEAAVTFQADSGRIANLTLRHQTDDSLNMCCVDIVQGKLELEDCDISSDKTCMEIHNSSVPCLRRNRIHNGKNGIWISGNSNSMLENGVLEDNDISGNEYGIIIEGSNPTLRRNRIHDGKCGVLIWPGGKGFLENNDIFNNEEEGVFISFDSNPALHCNHIHDSKGNGVIVNGRGELEDNKIFGNSIGVMISNSGKPTLRRNRINKASIKMEQALK